MVSILIQMLWYGLMIQAVAILVGNKFWILSLFAEMVPQFALVAAVCIVVLLFQQQYVQAAVLFCLTAYLAWPVAALWVPQARVALSASRQQQRITVLTANVNAKNEQYALLVDRISDERPTVVLLQESSDAWIDAVGAGIAAEYPYRIEHRSPGYRGMALFSSIPIASHELAYFAPDTAPFITAHFAEPRVTIVSVHTLSPVSEQWIKERNASLEWMVEQLKTVSGPLVVAGDFNITVTNPLFRRFLDAAQLQDSRKGYGWQPSWMRDTLVAAAIDHILYRGVAVQDFKVLASIGSDHRPVQAEFVITEP